MPLFSAPRHVVGALCLVQKDHEKEVSAEVQHLVMETAESISRLVSDLFARAEQVSGYSPSIPQSMAASVMASP